MKRVLIARQVTKTKWKVRKTFSLSKSDIAAVILAVVSVGYVTIRSLIG